MSKFKIALSMGHTPDFPGATRGSKTEYGISAAVIGDLAFRLDKLGHEAWIIGADSNRNQVEEINKLNPDFGLELHFNNKADQPDWSGSLCMHAGSKKGKRLAKHVNNNVYKILATKNKGIHVGHYQLDVRKEIITMIKDTNCPFIIVEPLFLSNISDFKKIDITLISVGILRGCLSYWESL